MSGRLTSLEAGQVIVYGGDRVTTVPPALADAFADGDHLIVVQETGDLLHVPAAEREVADRAVTAAVDAFGSLGACGDDQITRFFGEFADRLADDRAFAAISDANACDIEVARGNGRSTTRLELSPKMRGDMIAGLRMWRDSSIGRETVDRRIEHDGWSLEAMRAPVGVVGFVFEGRPNVFADAAGVVRAGNTVVMRIGSDALGTARAIVEHALGPAAVAAGLPAGTMSLVDSPSRAAGWALFSDRRLSLAVARGSGPAVAQLGAVARQSGINVSLHGTGGAWMVAGHGADPERFELGVKHSLDRKVCNTLNVCAIPRARATELVPRFLAGLDAAAGERSVPARLHADDAAWPYVPAERRDAKVTVRRTDGEHLEPAVSPIDRDDLGREWEWESSPEVTLIVVDDIDEAVALCNRYSPRFVAAMVTGDPEELDRFYRSVDAPFVGDGFTRWVDGQYALNTPELGLSNWEGGRLLGRGGVLSGDSVFTIRYKASIGDPTTRR